MKCPRTHSQSCVVVFPPYTLICLRANRKPPQTILIWDGHKQTGEVIKLGHTVSNLILCKEIKPRTCPTLKSWTFGDQIDGP